MNSKLKQHHWLLTALIVYNGPNGQPGIKYMNTVVVRPTKVIPMKSIIEAQQAVTFQFCTMSGISTDNVMDVNIIATSYLGHMSQEEFSEGTEQEETNHDPNALKNALRRVPGETDEEASERLRAAFDIQDNDNPPDKMN